MVSLKFLSIKLADKMEFSFLKGTSVSTAGEPPVYASIKSYLRASLSFISPANFQTKVTIDFGCKNYTHTVC